MRSLDQITDNYLYNNCMIIFGESFADYDKSFYKIRFALFAYRDIVLHC